MTPSCRRAAAAPGPKQRSIAPKAEAFLFPPAACRWSSRSCAAWGACRSARSFVSHARSHSPASHSFPLALDRARRPSGSVQREACPSRVLVARRSRTACTYPRPRDAICLCCAAPVMLPRVHTWPWSQDMTSSRLLKEFKIFTNRGTACTGAMLRS